MEINTGTLGPIEIDENRIISLTKPLEGVDMGGVRYALLDLNPTSPVKLLQSVENPHICFLVGDPGKLLDNYVVALSLEELNAMDLGLDSLEEAAVLVVLTVLGGENGATTANLKAPIIVNRKSLRACQAILTDPAYPIRHPVVFAKA